MQEEEEMDSQGSWIMWSNGCRMWKGEWLVEEQWVGKKNMEDHCGGGWGRHGPWVMGRMQH